jgi:hypothetical protein
MAQGREIPPLSEVTSATCRPHRRDSQRVSVPLSKVVPWLSEAAGQGVAWVNDFGDEEICITSDLYDVILAYQHFHQD